MKSPPTDVTKTWPTPNYRNPVSRGAGLLGVELVFIIMALTVLGLRMYVRLVKIRRTWWDDWLMVGAAVLVPLIESARKMTDTLTPDHIATQSFGWTLHIWDVPVSKLAQSRQLSMAAQTLFLFASGLSKLSILASYLRIAAPGTGFQQLTWATGFVVFALIWVFLLVLWTQCAPMWQYWTLMSDWGTCMPEWPPLAGQGITTVLTNITVYLLPMPTLFQLQMPRAQRASLIALFGLGLIVVVAGIMRTYWVIDVEFSYFENPGYDLTWNLYNIWIWTALEADLAIICGCAPSLRPLFTCCGGRNRSQFKVGSSVLTTGSSMVKSFMRGARFSRQRQQQQQQQKQGVEDLEQRGLPSFESRGTIDSSKPRLVSVENEDKRMLDPTR